MLKLEEGAPCESLGPGSISKTNNIDMRGGRSGGNQLSFYDKLRFCEQNSQDVLSRVVGISDWKTMTFKSKHFVFQLLTQF